jgi:hypothetical protein
VHVTVTGTPPVTVQPVNLRVTLVLMLMGYVPDAPARVAVAVELVQLTVALAPDVGVITSRVALVAVAVTAPPGETATVEALARTTPANDMAITKTGTAKLRMRDICHRLPSLNFGVEEKPSAHAHRCARPS